MPPHRLSYCQPALGPSIYVERYRIEVNRLKAAQLATLRFVSLLFLLPGLGGLVISAMISTHYLDTMPRWPVPEEMRMTPRNIHGTVVYQTEEEDRRLSMAEYSSVGVFVIGLGLGLVYLEKWGAARAGESEYDELSEDVG
jgi:hypothetical protein